VPAPVDPSVATAQANQFTPGERDIVRDFFEKSIVAGDCPPLLQPRGDICASTSPMRLWRLAEPLPITAIVEDLPSGLPARIVTEREGRRVVRVGMDLLLIDSGRRVLDGILDLGSPRTATARARPAAPPPPPPKGPNR
jgi:hypothetical protein